MFKSSPSVNYQNAVEGTWGEFNTPTGKVAFILTKARLGTSGTDNERRLTAQLRPVREVLSADQLDFNQLLQRDLDDHRVAEGLIPYLLKPKVTGPAFFPPIMAILLPFSASKPADSFPEQDFKENIEDQGIHFEERRFGAAYRVQRLVNEKQEYHSIKLGRLGWNDEYAKIVVLDGQHRAMALLAIDRTINHLWGSTGAANRYRHFYEHRVRELLKSADPNFNLDKVEVPVTVCWFPELNGAGKDPHKAARKLFVDVNKEARAPSEARLTLLSDSELLNIFTRSLLNRLREDNPPLPLFAIEYDNPEKDAARPVKWSVLTNLNLLKFAVTRCVFGPKKYITDMRLAFGGRQPWSEMDGFMRSQLDVASIYPDVIEDGDRIIERSAIGNENFPVQQVEPLVKRFMDSWGTAILTILGNLKPYAAHCEALQYTKDHWVADDAFSSLAFDALFGGVGVFWTLRDSFNHWTDLKARCREEKRPEPTPPDIVKAWDAIHRKTSDFNEQRTRDYLEKKNEKEIERTNKFFEIVNTHACQLGVILTFASLAYATKKSHSEVASFAQTLVEAWNAALVSKRSADENRLLILAREPYISRPINRIGKMDTPLAIHFRYFWLELLRLDAARELLGDAIPADVVDDLAAKARTIYAEYLVEEQKKALGVSNPGANENKLRAKARDNVIKDLSRALSHWFDMPKADAETLVATALGKESTKQTPPKNVEGIEANDEASAPGAEPDVTPEKTQQPQDINELLDEFSDD